jgi:iron complex outermembrane receptor protein
MAFSSLRDCCSPTQSRRGVLTLSNSSIDVPVTSGSARTSSATLRAARASAVLVATFAALFMSSAIASVDGEESFHIQAERLDTALEEFSRQSHRHVTRLIHIDEASHSNSIQGEYSPEAALHMLLEGTGFTYRVTSDNTIFIERAAPGDTTRLIARVPTDHAKIPDDARARALVPVAQPQGTGDTPQTASDIQASPSQSDQQNDVQEVLVSGSRLITNGTASPTPVTVLSATELTDKAPTNLPDALNQLPQFVNSSGPTRTSPVLHASPLSGNYLNLRGLGPNRTLILLDGDRVAPTNADGTVDTDIIPQLLVQRVDVVTGGASAVYGSDAVVGVVNFVLDKNFNGLKLVAQTGLSTYQDDGSSRLGVVGGTSLFDDNLHVEGSVEHYHSNGIFGMGSRPHGSDLDCNTGSGTASNPYTLQSNCRLLAAGEGGEITSGPLAGNVFGVNGTSLQPLNLGNPAGVGGNGEDLGTDWTLIIPLQTTQEFGRVSYKFTPDVTAYAQLAGSQVVNGSYESAPNGFYSGGTGITIFSGNPFLPSAVQAAMAPGSSFTMSEDFNPQQAAALGLPSIPHQVTEEKTRSLIAKLGVAGNLWSDWKWDASYSHGNSSIVGSSQEVQMNKFTAAVDAVSNNGQIVCRVSITNPGLYPGCVPLDVFGVGTASQAAINYVLGDSIYNIVNKTDIVTANLRGSPFSLWDRNVEVSLGSEYRHQSLTQTSNADPAIPVDTTGLRGAGPDMPQFNLTNVGTANGAVSVKEVYGEFLLPLVRDAPLVSSLDVNGAARYTDYSTSGSVETWKIGLSYAPIADLRLRGTVSRDIRAPSLLDLFSGQQGTVLLIDDPHTNVTSVANTFVTSNPNLTPERGLTKSIGFVYQPKWLTGLDVEVDAYDIDITNAIFTPDFLTNVTSCEQSGGVGPTCPLVVRPHPFSDTSSDNFPVAVYSYPLNIASEKQHGIDVELSYSKRADEIIPRLPGSFTIRGFGTFVPEFNDYLSSTTPVEKTAGYLDNPKARGSVQVSYEGSPWHVFLQERFTGSYNLSAYQGASVYANNGNAPDRIYTDVTVGYKMFDKAEVFLTVNNLLNVQPPVLISGNGLGGLTFPTDKETYDVIGRYFTLGVKASF